ncbi:MAG: restriction endonuclease subunit S [Methylobacter sp.]|nr:restriction endonuclease subunit S [Methylobacter sp.]
MVATTAYQSPVIWDAPSKPQNFSWVSLPIQSVFENGLRLEASVYATEAQNSKLLVTQCKYGAIPLTELTNECTYPGRFKRAYVLKQHGEKFFLPSQLNELAPSATKFLAVKKIKELDALRIKGNTLLITRSGTIGNCTIASKTLLGGIFSDDVIRLTPKQTHNLGYIYIYLKSRTGRAILQSSNYGAVIQHVEPTHLLNLPIPNAPPILKTHIHHTVTESFNLRDKSNDLITQARAKLQAALKLPAVEELNSPASGGNGLRCFSVNVADVNYRLEANYHNPLAQAITQHLHKHASQVLALGDKQLTQKIILPGRFKRIYVDEKQGVPFLGGKEILELDPRGEKYLSLKHHGERIAEQLTLDENMILITCSGTIGKVNIVPKHWQGWAGSQHILRAVPANAEWAGYLYAWLSSEWALPLIRRHTYGAVVFEIDQYQLAEVPVPMLIDVAQMREINSLVLKANELRYIAFTKEQEALRLFNEDVLGLPSTVS